jgi:hypothetical protein
MNIKSTSPITDSKKYAVPDLKDETSFALCL